MTYKIKPEYLDLWGADATEDTIITNEDLEMIARGWEKTPDELMDQLIPVGYWYAVLMDKNDNDWGYGSYDRAEAVTMAKNLKGDHPDAFIAVIDNHRMSDPVCVDEIRDLGEDEGTTVFEGFTPDGVRCEVVLENGFLYVVTADGKERFNEERYFGDEDIAFMLIHDGFRRG